MNTSFAGENENGRYKIDKSSSSITWIGEKVTGSHTGGISILNGSLSVENNALTYADVNVDMNSLTCTDLENSEYNAKLVGHLKSPDFFDVENHAAASFTLNTFTKKQGENGTNYEVTGNLTIKGTRMTSS